MLPISISHVSPISWIHIEPHLHSQETHILAHMWYVHLEYTPFLIINIWIVCAFFLMYNNSFYYYNDKSAYSNKTTRKRSIHSQNLHFLIYFHHLQKRSKRETIYMARLHLVVTYTFPWIHLFHSISLSRSFFDWNSRSSRILKLYNTLFYALIAIFIEDFCEQCTGHRHILPYIILRVYIEIKMIFFFASPSTWWKSTNQQQNRHTKQLFH